MDKEKMFYVIDGQVASDVNDLLKAINTMQENAYIYHANKQKNDFSNWLRDVLNEKEIAEKIRTSSQKEAVKILEEHLRPKTIIQHVIHNTKKLRSHINKHIKNTLSPSKNVVNPTSSDESKKQNPEHPGVNAVNEAVQETKSLDTIINPSLKNSNTAQNLKSQKDRVSKVKASARGNRPSASPLKKSEKNSKNVKISEVRKLKNVKDVRSESPLSESMMPRALSVREKDDQFSKALNEIIAREKRIELLESQIEEQINHSKTMKSEDFVYGIIVGIVLAFSIYLIYGAIV